MARQETTRAEEPRRWTAAEYVATLHPPGSRGCVTLLAREGVGLRSRTYSADDVRSPVVLGVYEETPAAYIAMNRFYGPRGGGRRLAALNGLWLDLDIYKSKRWAHADPEAVARELVVDIDRRGLPRPSVIVSSGRGLYALWLTTPAPARAESRWRAGMRAMVGLFDDWQADPACIDPARVLRLVGSVNDKSGAPVRIVWGRGSRHDFDRLLDAVFTAAGRATRADLSRRRARPKTASKACSSGRPRPPSRWPAVLRDLERIRDHHGGRIPIGMRDLWLHLRAVALSHVTAPSLILSAVLGVAASVAPGVSEREVGRWIGPAIRRAEDAAAGRRNARGADPRYAYAGARMADLLGIDEASARGLGLEQIIPATLRTERRASRRRERRRAAGALPRAVWLAAHPVSRTRPWEAESVSRATWYRRRRAQREARIRAARKSLLRGAAPVLAPFETGPVPLYGGVASPRDRARRPSAVSGLSHPTREAASRTTDAAPASLGRRPDPVGVALDDYGSPPPVMASHPPDEAMNDDALRDADPSPPATGVLPDWLEELLA